MMQTKRITAIAAITGASLLGGILVPAAAIAHTSRPKPCIVPRVTGDSLPTARRRIDRAGCRVGKVHRPKDASRRLVVRSESPRPSKRHRKHGTRVSLVLKVKRSTAPTVGVKAPVTTTASTVLAPVTTTASTVLAPVVRASIDPDYTQDPSNPLDVTWTYSASATGTTSAALPSGVLAFSVTPDTGGLGPVGGCSINVDAMVTGGTCTVDLPSYGAYTITVTYTGSGGTVAPATFTENETISPPPPIPPATTATTLNCTIGPVSSPLGLVGTNAASCNASTFDASGGSVSLANSVTWTVVDDDTGQTLASSVEMADGAVTIGVEVECAASGYEDYLTGVDSVGFQSNFSTVDLTATASYVGDATDLPSVSNSANFTLAMPTGSGLTCGP